VRAQLQEAGGRRRRGTVFTFNPSYGSGGSALWLRYSPDGTRVRFTILDPTTRSTSLWELSADGKDLRPLLADWSNPPAECCGNWTADGAYFVFQSTRDKMSNVWAWHETKRMAQASAEPLQITAGPLQYLAPVPARRGNQIFVVGTQGRSQLSRFDAKSRRFAPFLAEIASAGRTEFSADATRVAWLSTSDGSLWQSLLDGTQRVQLSSHPMRVPDALVAGCPQDCLHGKGARQTLDPLHGFGGRGRTRDVARRAGQ
jgi:Tol biopolymer transport system component